MQKRSNTDFAIESYELHFDKDFPVCPPWGLYTVGEGEISSLHYHNGLELGVCYKGSGVFLVDNKILPYSSGDASVIFKNETHKAQSHNHNLSQWKFLTIDVEALLAHLSFEQLAPILKIVHGDNDFQNIIKGYEYPEIIMMIQEIIDEVEDEKEEYQSVVRGLTWALMLKLARIIQVSEKKQIYDQSRNRLMIISPALNYISKHYSEEISASSLAKVCQMSDAHFRRVFKRVMDLSPIEYVYHIRIKMAAILLGSTELSIMEISLQVGYLSITSFNRHFKRIIGSTPKEFRRKAKGVGGE